MAWYLVTEKRIREDTYEVEAEDEDEARYGCGQAFNYHEGYETELHEVVSVVKIEEDDE